MFAWRADLPAERHGDAYPAVLLAKTDGDFFEQNSFSGKLLKFLGFLSRARARGYGALESDAYIKTHRDIEI
jgi:hypothetical protein